MSSAQQKILPRRQIILHHLSGLHYEDTAERRQDSILVRYKGYLEGLPAERRPDLIVITGDLTSTGKRQDLSAVAITLRACFPAWAGRLNEHVFVVPGPRDMNWEDANDPGLTAFFDIFSDFALPAHAPTEPQASTASECAFIAYPIDTCYAPNELKPGLKLEFTRYAQLYSRYIKLRDKSKRWWLGLGSRLLNMRRNDRRKARAALLANLRNRYLELTEGAGLAALEAGRISFKDSERFERWAEPLIQSAASDHIAAPPLKILISHHPLAIHPEPAANDSEDERQPAQHPFKQLARTVRAAGFHLALHGHMHKPQLLSDLSILEGLDAQRPMRQIGAPSLGDTGVFNEITAIYRENQERAQGQSQGQGQDDWRLEFRLVNVKPTMFPGVSSIALPNSTEVADNIVALLRREARQRADFERSVRIVMRRFSEQVYQISPDHRQERSNGVILPQAAMQLAGDVISSVIFKGYEARVRLLLKSKEDHSHIPKLIPTYLTPAVMEGPDALVYPACVAAWSLALGRTLIYPGVVTTHTTTEDHEWLRRTNKFPELLDALSGLMREAFEKSYPGAEVAKRYETLHTNLTAIQSKGEAVITGKDIYQTAPDGSPPGSYPGFICVPFPMRPSGGALPALPEIVVLDVGVRQVERPDGAREMAPEKAMEPFTPERVEMLETLTELIGMMLTTSSALGKPRGVWDDRYWP